MTNDITERIENALKEWNCRCPEEWTKLFLKIEIKGKSIGDILEGYENEKM